MQLKLNELVPPKLYAAVAEVLAWAYELDDKTLERPAHEWAHGYNITFLMPKGLKAENQAK